MGSFGYGYSSGKNGRKQHFINVTPLLRSLGISPSIVAEDASIGTTVGSLVGLRNGSTVTLLNDAGGIFALNGTSVEVAGAGLDFESLEQLQVTVRETNAGFANSPRDSVLDISVSNVFEQPALSSLSLSASTINVDEAITINIIGATSGSLIEADSLPAGLTLDSVARTITGTPTAVETLSFTLTETLLDSANSPNQTNLEITVQTAASLSLAEATYGEAYDETVAMAHPVTGLPVWATQEDAGNGTTRIYGTPD